MLAFLIVEASALRRALSSANHRLDKSFFISGKRILLYDFSVFQANNRLARIQNKFWIMRNDEKRFALFRKLFQR